jgi:hypothetical protein
LRFQRIRIRQNLDEALDGDARPILLLSRHRRLYSKNIPTSPRIPRTSRAKDFAYLGLRVPRTSRA